ncbi:hypothetical protein DFH09DRAFT_428814 [Mycena vulgaris]|nr:hypothetical protein DFH09DRAFT_428814 [Mycena vulgaris]
MLTSSFTDTLHLPAIRGHRRRSPFVLLLLRRPLRPLMDEPTPPPTYGDRRSLSPEAYARGGPLSSDFARTGSLSPDFARAVSMSPEYGHAHGQEHMPMTEDELVYTPSRSRSASADPANGAPSNHPCADSDPVRIPPHMRLPACRYTRRAMRGHPHLAFTTPPAPLSSTVVLFSAVSAQRLVAVHCLFRCSALWSGPIYFFIFSYA